VQEQLEQEIGSIENSLETALKQLWERAYAASTAISSLREEKHAIQLRANDLEAKILQMQTELSAKDAEIDKLQKEVDTTLLMSVSNGSLNKEERMVLQEKVKAILDKINSHL
jgi:Tfp pilus assembly protein FimV